MDSLVSTSRLLEITGYKTVGDMERCLTEQGIRLFRGKGGMVWTTMELINQAGGLAAPHAAPELYPADSFR